MAALKFESPLTVYFGPSGVVLTGSLESGEALFTAEKLRLVPWHTGAVLVAVGSGAGVATIELVVPEPGQPKPVAVTV